MPVEDPQSGEVWTTTDIGSGRLMQGIVADVSPTRVLFVSLSGNRVAVPLSRLRTNWHFVQGVPRRTLPPCERVGCATAGMIEYDRGNRAVRTCPKHAPFGIQCRITQNYVAPAEARNIRPGFECRSTPCPTCGNQDPAEDVRIAVYPARLWFCPSCNGRWVTLPRVPEDDEQDIERVSIAVGDELRRLHYDVDSILVLHPETWDDLRRNPRVVVGDAGEAIRRMVIGNMQSFLESAAITSDVRDHFHAIVRVRNDVTRQADRPVHRLGGSPNRAGVIGSSANPVRPAPVPPPEAPMLYRPTGVPEAAAHAATLHRLRQEERSSRDLFESPESVEIPVPDIPIDKESAWVQRMSGDVMVVLDVIQATDGTDAISFRRRSAEEVEPAVTMTRRDFLIHHKPHMPSTDARMPPMIPVAVDEEWECSDGSGMVITQVDHRKEIVYGDDVKTKRHRQIPFVQFATGRWRKIVRRSVYERLRQPEIHMPSGPDDE